MPNGKPGDLPESDYTIRNRNQFSTEIGELVQEIYRLNNNDPQILDEIDWSKSKDEKILKKRLKEIIKKIKTRYNNCEHP